MNEIPSLETATSGSIRFNTDSSKLEIYNGEAWFNIDSTSPAEQTGGTRGLWVAGNNPTYYNEIQFANIDTSGNTIDFGDINEGLSQVNLLCDRTRGVCGGGYDGTNNKDIIQFFTIASTGDATDFGDLVSAIRGVCSVSDKTRGIFCKGYVTPANVNIMQYVTIQSTGDSIDFGDIPDSGNGGGNTHCSQTRGIIGQCSDGSNSDVNRYITMSTLGNAADFGDQTSTDTSANGVGGNSVRGIAFKQTNSIDFLTIATLGNSLDFGDTAVVGFNGGGVASSPTRVVVGGGFNNPGSGSANQNYMNSVQIASTGNAVDFGDLIRIISSITGGSNGHGGLG